MAELIAGPATPQEVAVELNNRLVREKWALEAENARLTAELAKAKADGWCDVCCGKGDPGTGKPCICGGSGLAQDAVHGLRKELVEVQQRANEFDVALTQIANYLDAPAAHTTIIPGLVYGRVKRAEHERDQLAAQVERLRGFVGKVQKSTIVGSWRTQGEALLAETPAASLAAVREQARREAEMPFRKALWGLHGHSGIYGDDGEMQCVECAQYGVTDYKRDDAGKVIGAAIYALQEVVQRCKDEVRREARREALEEAIAKVRHVFECHTQTRARVLPIEIVDALRDLAAQPAKEQS